MRIHYDSEYAAQIASGTFNANKNVELAESCKGLLGQVCETRRVSFVKVKGHSNNVLNDRADANANLGAQGKRLLWSNFSSPLIADGPEEESELHVDIYISKSSIISVFRLQKSM